MTYYKISKEELEAFAKKVYEEACYGYLDLKDSVCDGMLRDFLDGRKILPPIDTNIMPGPPPMPSEGVFVGRPDPTGPVGYGASSDRAVVVTITSGYQGDPQDLRQAFHAGGEVGWEIATDSINDIPVPMSAATGLDSPPLAAAHENEGIRIRASNGHQFELTDDVRPETNFQGNESERF